MPSRTLEVTMGTVAGLARDGTLLTLDRHLVETLRAALRGPLLAAGDPGYEEARSFWNGMIDRRRPSSPGAPGRRPRLRVRHRVRRSHSRRRLRVPVAPGSAGRATPSA